jgi:hypothetical protein
MKTTAVIGLAIWLGATIALRLLGHLFFPDVETSKVLALGGSLLLGNVVVLLTAALWRSQQPADTQPWSAGPQVRGVMR